MCEVQFISSRCKTEEPYVAGLIKSNELLSTAVQKITTHNKRRKARQLRERTMFKSILTVSDDDDENDEDTYSVYSAY